MRSLLRSLVVESVGRVKSISKGIHILNGHYISKDNDASQEIFYNQIKELKKQADFIDPITACKLIDEQKTSEQAFIALTFDDGFEECYTKIAPVLNSFDIKAGFFINPNFHTSDVDYQKDFLLNKVNNPQKKPMNVQMIKSLSDDGHIIGGHTMDHQRLNINDLSELEYQIIACKEAVEQITSKLCESFAWPYGTLNDINADSRRIMLENYTYVFSSCCNQFYKIDDQIYNRRHFEGNWPISHLNYFLSSKKYNFNLR